MGKLVHGSKVYAQVVHGTAVTPALITDVSGFTKVYDTSSGVDYGSSGAKVSSALDITDADVLTAYMQGGWNESHACFYNSENKIGAYAGYNFLTEINIDKADFWIGRYSAQNKTLYVTVQYLDSLGNWSDITTLEITSDLGYPLNVFSVYINRKCYGVRWIHSSEAKTSGNNIIFFGMCLYRYVDVDITNIPRIAFSSWDKFKRLESSSVMQIVTTSDTVKSTWLGGNNIGANFTVPIDVTNIDEIGGYVDIGTGYSLTSFPFYVALCGQFPNSTAGTPSSWSPVVQDSSNVANSTYHFSLDTSNLTGGYMLVFILTGMNATIRDVNIISEHDLKELYSFDQSQGGAWINTNVDVTNLPDLLFRFYSTPGNYLMRQLHVSDIAVYTGGADVFTTIFPSDYIGRALNVRIYNNMLWVSFNGTGPSTSIVTIYTPIVF